MNDKVKFLKDWGRMCKGLPCKECKLDEPTGSCIEIASKDPQRAIEIIEKWAKENPEKTYKDDFLEKFPNAPIDDYLNSPKACTRDIYNYPKSCPGDDCEKCWTAPMEV